METSDDVEVASAAQRAGDWFDEKMGEAIREIDHLYDEFRLSEALMATYRLVWDDYCSWYLEAIKPPYGSPVATATRDRAIKHFEDLLRLLHPIMPFITEELWQAIRPRSESEALIVSQWFTREEEPARKTLDDFAYTTELITAIRGVRAEKGLSPRETLDVMTCTGGEMVVNEIVEKLANIRPISIVKEKPEGVISIMVRTDEYFIPVGDKIDVEAELARLEKDLEYAQGFLASVRKKLSNERFVTSAPEAVVNAERKKEADALSKIATIEQAIKSLK
jgi:valyl-tRNA synthetase